MNDASQGHGAHLAELGVLQHRVKEDVVGVNIFSCEVPGHSDVLRTLGTFSIKRVQCKLAYIAEREKKIQRAVQSPASSRPRQ